MYRPGKIHFLSATAEYVCTQAWIDNDPEDGHFDFIPVEYLYDATTNSVTSEIAPVVTYRGEHDPYDESEWESQN